MLACIDHTSGFRGRRILTGTRQSLALRQQQTAGESEKRAIHPCSVGKSLRVRSRNLCAQAFRVSNFAWPLLSIECASFVSTHRKGPVTKEGTIWAPGTFPAEWGFRHQRVSILENKWPVESASHCLKSLEITWMLEKSQEFEWKTVKLPHHHWKELLLGTKRSQYYNFGHTKPKMFKEGANQR